MAYRITYKHNSALDDLDVILYEALPGVVRYFVVLAFIYFVPAKKKRKRKCG